jgi:hypothetical protein
MNHWIWPVSLFGIHSTAVVCGTDIFFLSIGRPALRLASPAAGTDWGIACTRLPSPRCALFPTS